MPRRIVYYRIIKYYINRTNTFYMFFHSDNNNNNIAVQWHNNTHVACIFFIIRARVNITYRYEIFVFYRAYTSTSRLMTSVHLRRDITHFFYIFFIPIYILQGCEIISHRTHLLFIFVNGKIEKHTYTRTSISNQIIFRKIFAFYKYASSERTDITGEMIKFLKIPFLFVFFSERFIDAKYFI